MSIALMNYKNCDKYKKTTSGIKIVVLILSYIGLFFTFWESQYVTNYIISSCPKGPLLIHDNGLWHISYDLQ